MALGKEAFILDVFSIDTSTNNDTALDTMNIGVIMMGKKGIQG